MVEAKQVEIPNSRTVQNGDARVTLHPAGKRRNGKPRFTVTIDVRSEIESTGWRRLGMCDVDLVLSVVRACTEVLSIAGEEQ
jgi:hypothetical protein